MLAKLQNPTSLRFSSSRKDLLRLYPERLHGLIARAFGLAVLLAVEYVLSVVWPFGHNGYGFKASVITLAVTFSTFAYLRNEAVLRRISQRLSAAPVNRLLLAGHFLAMTAYGSICWAYGARAITSHTGLAFPLRLVSGGTGVILAACAFIPLALWVELIRDTGWLWLYALLASATTYGAVDYIERLWSSGLFEQLTFTLSKAFLTPFASATIADSSSRALGTPRFSVEIAPACSGIEGVGLMLVFSVLWLWLYRRECRFPRALIVIPAGMAIAFVLNSARITALILIGDAGAPEIAMGGFHSAAGWCAFCGAALGLSVAARRLPWLMIAKPRGHHADGQAWENPTAAYLLPLCSILAVALVTTLAKGDFDWLYPARFVAAAGLLWGLRKRYGALNWRFGWFGLAIGILTFGAWIAVDRFLNARPSDSMPQALANTPGPMREAWILFRVLSAVVTVPVAEELAFRGFLMRYFISTDFESVPLTKFTWLGLGVSSILFGLLHGKLWFAGLLAGLFYGWAMIRRGRFGDAVIAHATTNALLAGYTLILQRWHMWF